MGFRQDLYHGNTIIDFVPKWRISARVSAAMVAIAVLSLVVLGLKLSIEFEGGGTWQVPVPDGVTVADGRAAAGLDEARVQILADLDGGNQLRVQSDASQIDQSAEVVKRLAALAGVETNEVKVDTVGPTWGRQITGKAVRALVLFFFAVAFYLAWTLEWRMAAGALVAVVHDLVITAGVYALFRFEVSPATVIALLTILGYSLYDTVVVYDKVRENQNTPMADGISHTQLINRSMNQVLMRSVNTTITTVLPVASMLLLGGLFLGGSALRGFALALFIGLILGTYSSIFVAAPLLAWLKEREPETEEYRRRMQRAAEMLPGEEHLKGDEPVAVPESGVSGAVIVPKGRKKRR